MNRLINGWIKSSSDDSMPFDREIWWSPTSALEVYGKEKKEITKQNQHTPGLHGDCILRKEINIKLNKTLLFKLLFW